MHYSRHRLTASVAYVTTRTYASTKTSKLALLAHWPVRQKLYRVSSVKFNSVALYVPLIMRFIKDNDKA